MNQVSAMSIGDLFDRTFKLLGRTFSRNISIGVVVFIPAVLAMVFALNHFIDAAIVIIKELDSSHPDPWQLLRVLIQPGVFLVGATLLLSIGNLLINLAMMNVLGAEMVGEARSWMDALGASAGMPLLRAIGASILQGLAISAVIVVPILIMATGLKWMIILGVFITLGGIAFAVYLAISWALILPVIAVEEDTILHAFTRSMYLIRDYWWRTLGVLILFSMAAQLAVSLVSTPVSFILLWGFWSKYFTLIASAGSTDVNPNQIVDMFSGIGIGYAAILGLTMLMTTLIQSAYMIVIYYDLRARKGEFGREPVETSHDITTLDLPDSGGGIDGPLGRHPDAG